MASGTDQTEPDTNSIDLKKSKGDYLHSIVTAGTPVVATIAGTLGADPITGAAAGIGSFVFSAVVSKPLERRLHEWREKVGTDIEKLKSNGITVESLSNDERFITIVSQATLIAIRNHHDVKLTALRNATLNTALSIDMDENEELMFLSLIDNFTPLHLVILQFYSSRGGTNPILLQPSGMKDMVDYELEERFPELSGKCDFYYVIVKELHTQGLIDTN